MNKMHKTNLLFAARVGKAGSHKFHEFLHSFLLFSIGVCFLMDVCLSTRSGPGFEVVIGILFSVIFSLLLLFSFPSLIQQ